MPRDSETTPTVNESFNQTAATDSVVAPEQLSDSQTALESSETIEPGADFESTTTLQVELEIERYDVLDAHDARWNRERDRLTAKPVEALSLDLGGDSGRSIQKEYTERRSLWEGHRDAINRLFDRQVPDLRPLGTTMTDQFSKAGDQAPEPGQELAAPLNMADAPEAAETNDNANASRTSFRVEFHRQVRKTSRSI